MDDLLGLVRDDHACISSLFDELQAAADNPARLAVLWAHLSGVLFAHVSAFEEVCKLPLARTVPDGAAIREELGAQSLDICQAVAEADLAPAGSARWWLAVRAAETAVDAHVSSVEAGPLPRFAQRVPESVRRELGRQWKGYVADFADDRRGGVG